MDVCVLANPFLLNWQRRAIEAIRSVDDVEIPLVVVDESQRDDDSTVSKGADAINDDSIGLREVKLFFELLRSDGAYPLVYADQQLGWLLGDGQERRERLRSFPIEEADCLPNAEIVDCAPISADENWNELPDDAVDEIAERTDVVVRFGFGLITGRILEAPTHGVLSTHGSDIREWRGLGPQIALLRGRDQVTVTLQQLTDDIDGGNVVCMLTEPIEKPYTLADVWTKVYDLQARSYAQGLERLREPEFEPTPPEELGEYYPLSKKKELTFVARILARNNLARIRKAT